MIYTGRSEPASIRSGTCTSQVLDYRDLAQIGLQCAGRHQGLDRCARAEDRHDDLESRARQLLREHRGIAFAPSRMVPGIEPSEDRMLQGRLFAYATHRCTGWGQLQQPARESAAGRCQQRRPGWHHEQRWPPGRDELRAVRHPRGAEDPQARPYVPR